MDEKVLRTCLGNVELREDVLALLDDQLLLGIIEEKRPQGVEEMLDCVEEFVVDCLQLSKDAALAVMDALDTGGFLSATLDFFASQRVVVVGDRLYARVQEEWYRGTVESHEMTTQGDVYVVSLDDFVGAHRVRRDDMSMDWEMASDIGSPDAKCELCERVSKLTAHHLRPKEVHTKYLKLGFTRQDLAKCTMICRPCHSAVHRAASNEELAKSWYTIELLRTNGSVIRFVEWVKRTPVKAKHKV